VNWFPGLAGSRYATRAAVMRLLEIEAGKAVQEALQAQIDLLDEETKGALEDKASEADLVALAGVVAALDGEVDALQEFDGVASGHISSTDNPHSVTKEQVGLGNVDNTSDADKPISTLTQEALDTKADAGYVDIDFPIIIRTTGPNRPTLETLVGNIEAPRWAVNAFTSIEGQEIVHGYKEGTAIQWHVHMVTNGTNVDDRFVRWEIEWTWANANQPLSSVITTTSADLLIPADTPDRSALVREIAIIEMPTMTIGAHIWARLRRIAATGAAPTGDPFLTMLQLHIDCDTYGSAELNSKD
jgi:hypothetical protein